tara:strand:+ start:1308 stop:2279 length:972 start_codon:yes stop_codon:yes gene_type:complete
MKKLLNILLFVPLALFGQEDDPCYSINDVFNQISNENPPLEINLDSGWNMIGYPCFEEVIISDAFSSIIDDVIIVKNNNGSVFIPEFNFNGVGFLERGQGYKINMDEIIIGFSFCQSIQLPSIDGCTDCEASNFNQWANVDDGSCNYIYLGANLYGGIVFYIDETGQHGLVTAMEDLTEGSTDPYGFGANGYEWGCYQEPVQGADGTSIGTGYQNTMEILNQVCTTNNGGITAVQAAYNFDSDGYDDWYLPSKDELIEIYNTYIQTGLNNNLVGFETINWPYYWSSSESINSNAVWGVDFSNGLAGSTLNKFYAYRVRAIRAF